MSTKKGPNLRENIFVDKLYLLRFFFLKWSFFNDDLFKLVLKNQRSLSNHRKNLHFHIH